MTAYHVAQTVSEAIFLLERYQGKAAVICGGTDLVVQLKAGTKSFEALVDISDIPEMKTIEEDGDYLVVGGSVTHAEAAANALIREYAACLAKGCGIVGSPQIRNAGSLSGNIVNAQPAADSAVALIALGAEAVIAGTEGLRNVPVESLYHGVGSSAVDYRREIIRSLRFRKLDRMQGEYSAVQRLSQRKMLSLPMLNIAVAAKIKDECFEWFRLAAGPVARVPFRDASVEASFAGQKVCEATIREIAEKYKELAAPRNSRLRGSAEYRKEMFGVLTERALMDIAGQDKER